MKHAICESYIIVAHIKLVQIESSTRTYLNGVMCLKLGFKNNPPKQKFVRSQIIVNTIVDTITVIVFCDNIFTWYK